jgi:hypothetical protein
MASPEFIGVAGLPRSSRHTNGLMALQDMKLLWEDYGIIGNIIVSEDLNDRRFQFMPLYSHSRMSSPVPTSTTSSPQTSYTS